MFTGRKIVAWTIIGMFLAMMIVFTPVRATPTTELDAIGTSIYWDYYPQMFGSYVVWQEGYNADNSVSVDVFEPSWIMLYNKQDGTAVNITSNNITTIIGDMSATNYYAHAGNPAIDGDHVVFYQTYSSGAHDMRSQLVMYKISDGTSWVIKSTGYYYTQYLKICDDWIAYGYQNNYGGYLYNYVTGVPKTFNSPGAYYISGMALNDQFFAYSLYTGGTRLAYIFNITSYKNVNISNTSYLTTNVESLKDNQIGVTLVACLGVGGQYDTAICTLNSNGKLNWTAVEVGTDVSTTGCQLDSKSDWAAVNQWSGNSAPPGGNFICTIMGYNPITNETLALTSSPYCDAVFQFANGQALIATNRNSDNNIYYDARANWDIYITRTQSDVTFANMFELFEVILPIIIIIGVVVAVIKYGDITGG